MGLPFGRAFSGVGRARHPTFCDFHLAVFLTA